MNNLNTITQDWTHADQFLNDKIDKNNNSIKHDFDELTSDVNTRFTSVENEVKMLNGTADGQFIYDTEAKMTKVVPDGVNKGIVSMVGGKTVKTKNLFSSYTSMGKYVESSEKYNGHPCITSTSGFYGASDENLTLYPGKTYVIRCAIKSSNTSAIYIFYGNTGTGSIRLGMDGTSVSKANEWTVIKTKFTPTNKVFNVRVECTTVGATTTISEFMVAETTNMDIPYELPDYLYNAPVTEFTFNSKNMHTGIINGLTNLSQVNTNEFVSTAADTRETIPYLQTYMTPATVYRSVSEYHTFEDRVYISFQYEGENYIRIGHNGKVNDIKVRFEINSEDFIIGETYTVSWTFVGIATAIGMRLKDVQIEKASVPTPYAPYRKTTFSLESIVDKLPDYGISVDDEYNYIDFENMVYHHRVSTVDLGTLDWSLHPSYANLFYSVPIGRITQNNYGVECTKYAKSTGGWSEIADGTIGHGRPIHSASGGSFVLKDTKFSNATTLKENLKGVYANYKIEEELIPLTDLLLPFKCEPGGTVTFENEHNLDVPNTVIYEKEMK